MTSFNSTSFNFTGDIGGGGGDTFLLGDRNVSLSKRNSISMSKQSKVVELSKESHKTLNMQHVNKSLSLVSQNELS